MRTKAAYAACDREGVTKYRDISCNKGMAPARVGARFYKSIVGGSSAFIKANRAKQHKRGGTG
ncbi:hypothetical protein [uncultured Robinsoniella sp.]|uniref:hypothetical protein n=1 Tax=uncultured Robinsoniella sp. TaxID=904190 RepID=UPI00374F4718